MIAVTLLHKKLIKAGLPVVGVSGEMPPFLLEFSPEATAQQKTNAEIIAVAFDPVAELAAWEALEVGKIAAQSEAEVWFAANPGALALFNLAMGTLESEVNALIDAIIPLATASNRTKLKRLLMVGAVLDRSQVKKEGLG